MMRKNKDGESSHETVNKVPFLSLKGRGEGGFCFGYLIVILCMMMMIFILAVHPTIYNPCGDQGAPLLYFFSSSHTRRL